VGFYAIAMLTSYLARDVSRVEEELREKRADLSRLRVLHRDVIQSISSGLITTDLEGEVTSLNRTGENILARTEAELQGRSILESGLFGETEWSQMTSDVSTEPFRTRSELTLERGDHLHRLRDLLG
jgi:two-component system sensor histidine kinase PilS (NtrC family)